MRLWFLMVGVVGFAICWYLFRLGCCLTDACEFCLDGVCWCGVLYCGFYDLVFLSFELIGVVSLILYCADCVVYVVVCEFRCGLVGVLTLRVFSCRFGGFGF